jgi:rhodanese-related sulfurtransferase
MRSFCWACVAASVLAFGLACAQAPSNSKEIDYEQLAKLLEQPGKVFFLDVREPSEISSLGSVKGYVNIPMSQLEARLKEIPKDKVIVTL